MHHSMQKDKLLCQREKQLVCIAYHETNRGKISFLGFLNQLPVSLNINMKMRKMMRWWLGYLWPRPCWRCNQSKNFIQNVCKKCRVEPNNETNTHRMNGLSFTLKHLKSWNKLFFEASWLPRYTPQPRGWEGPASFNLWGGSKSPVESENQSLVETSLWVSWKSQILQHEGDNVRGMEKTQLPSMEFASRQNALLLIFATIAWNR